MERTRNDGSASDFKRNLRGRHAVALALSLLGIISIVLLVWMHRINEREGADILLANAIMDVQVSVASSHFKLEESFRKHIPGVEEEALSDLDHAIAQAKAIQRGGQSKFGPNLSMLKNSEFSVRAQEIVDMLLEMRALALQLSQVSMHSPFPEALDERFDQVCDRLLETAKSLELEVEKRAATHRKDSRNLVYWIFFAWSGVVLGSMIGLWTHERQRRQAAAAILNLNANLERQTEELTRHREHFMDLVEERTARLKLTNEELSAEIAERRQIERELRKSEERYRTLVETMDEGLTILDGDGRLVYVNDKFCRILGYSRDDILGFPLSKFIAFDRDIEVASEHLRKISARDHSRFEAGFFRKDGNIAYTIASLKSIRDTQGDGKGCFAVITDITEKTTLLANSLRTAHLASLGEMAAGVAHEINNPINGIINYACMLEEGKNTPELEREIAARIQTEGRRIAAIVRDLLLFGRAGIKEKVPVNVNEVLSKALNLVGNGLAQDGIETKVALRNELPTPIIDPQDLERVFFNILSNAKHALNKRYPSKNENKILEIRSEMVLWDRSCFVRIAFKDHGTGIPAHVIEKLKQPFFSTRPKGKGTGLGLSISDGIISECGGNLTIESVEGEYTEIKVDLPVNVGPDGRTFSPRSSVSTLTSR